MDQITASLRQLFMEDLLPAARELIAWLRWLGRHVLEALEVIAGRIFVNRRTWAQLRWLVLTLSVAGLWAIFAISRPPDIGGPLTHSLIGAQVDYVMCNLRSALVSDPQKNLKEQRCYRFEIGRSFTFAPLFFEAPFLILFAPSIFRHILILLFTAWLAHKVTAKYVGDIYELPDIACGEHYLLQSALINPYNTLHIREGLIDANETILPAYLIGGPAQVSVYLENAALFEKMDGAPRVLAPTGAEKRQVTTVDGFERLRSIIDLRDQREKFDVAGRSRDGIRVRAKDVTVVYSIYRDGQEPTYQRAYPFQNPQAVENLVYNQGVGPWTTAVGVQIRGELFDFYSNYSLSEFLATIQEPERKIKQERENELNQISSRLTGVGESPENPAVVSNPGGDFVPRSDITTKFYESARERSSSRGTQIDWVGVGTWDFPAQLILARHQEAWRITHDNLLKSNPAVLNKLKKQQRLNESLRLIQTVPIATFKSLSLAENTGLDDILRGLILAYHHQMNEASQDYQREINALEEQANKETDPIRKHELREKRQTLSVQRDKLTEVLEFLSRFTGRWL